MDHIRRIAHLITEDPDIIIESDDVAILRNDFEKLRGTILGRLVKEIDLLKEGLHALRLPTPKIHVTDDHVDRVIEQLAKLIDYLRSVQPTQ